MLFLSFYRLNNKMSPTVSMFRHFKSPSFAQLLLRIVPCMLAKLPFQKAQHYKEGRLLYCQFLGGRLLDGGAYFENLTFLRGTL